MSSGKDRNKKCYCGSGKKYKVCCQKSDRKFSNSLNPQMSYEQKKWFERRKQEMEQPVSLWLNSEAGAESSLHIHSVELTRGGETTKVVEDEITLATNKIDGDKTDSFAQFSLYPNKELKPRLETIGNASISNTRGIYDIAPLPSHFKKIVSPKGKKVRLKVDLQRDENFKFIDVLFLIGERHPHISFFPDGNGKFIGYRNYNCRLNTLLTYDKSVKAISPSEISIKVEDIDEELILNFEFDNKNKCVTMTKFRFI